MPRKQARPKGEIPVQLTELERKSILKIVCLKQPLKQKLVHSGHGVQVFRFSKKEIDALHDDIAMGALYSVDPHRKRLIAVQESLAEILDPEGVAGTGGRRRTLSKPSGLIHQFKITLLHTNPPIWRRILIKDETLDALHEHIQAAMGWSNSHLHEFVIGGQRYSNPAFQDFDFDDKVGDSTRTLLSAFLPTDRKPFRFEYVYDFGDNWEHEVIFESAQQPESRVKYPVCTDGALACPPEDVGGVWGFYDYVEALADPEHDQHHDFLEWGGRFDPEAFDATKTTKQMRRGLPSCFE